MLDSLGSGQFGVVYKARNKGTKGLVALKIIRSPDEQTAEAVLAEAQALRKADNKHTISVNTAFNEFGNGQFLSLIDMPLVTGGNLGKLYLEDQLSIRDILKATRHILFGLSGAHSVGVTHRDVKPSNVLVDGANFLLGDFGLAKTANTALADLPSYTRHHPPELNMFHSLYDPSASAEDTYDVYATGITLYRLMGEKRNYPIAERAFTSWMKNPNHKTLPNHIGYPLYVPRKIKSIIERATSLSPENRYQSANEMRRAVERLVVDINWVIPPQLPKWEATKSLGKNYSVELLRSKDKFIFAHKVNGRKPRDFTNYVGTRENCLRELSKFVAKTMIR